MVAKYIAGLRALLARRVVTIVAMAAVLASVIVILIRIGPPAHLDDLKLPDMKLPDLDMSKIPGLSHEKVRYEHCDPKNYTDTINEWKATREKYDKLIGDKFT
jgi:glucuronyl/N-acetylglucosaminyl transferase EXT2/alpha-1,4-N-acetylglucosaminyltransferase EXTL3